MALRQWARHGGLSRFVDRLADAVVPDVHVMAVVWLECVPPHDWLSKLVWDGLRRFICVRQTFARVAQRRFDFAPKAILRPKDVLGLFQRLFLAATTS